MATVRMSDTIQLQLTRKDLQTTILSLAEAGKLDAARTIIGAAANSGVDLTRRELMVLVEKGDG